MYYQIIAAKNEYIGIVWRFQGCKVLIENIFLPCSAGQLTAKIKKAYPEIDKARQKIPGGIARQIAKIYEGEEANIDLSLLNWEKLSAFSRKVFKATCKIPRGKVATYSGLAAKAGSSHAARAVGTALANNPFPLVIPCHRVVRTDGSLGGFGGGIRMKQELLAGEGVVSDGRGRVAAKCFSAG